MTNATVGQPAEADEQVEWTLKLRKIDAEIAQLNALTSKIVAETSRRMDADIAQADAQTRKASAEAARIEAEVQQRVAAEVAKLQAETAKLTSERFWYPMVATTALFVSAAAFVGAIIGLTRLFMG